jgi:hypothetical protein
MYINVMATDFYLGETYVDELFGFTFIHPTLLIRWLSASLSKEDERKLSNGFSMITFISLICFRRILMALLAHRISSGLTISRANIHRAMEL